MTRNKVIYLPFNLDKTIVTSELTLQRGSTDF